MAEPGKHKRDTFSVRVMGPEGDWHEWDLNLEDAEWHRDTMLERFGKPDRWEAVRSPQRSPHPDPPCCWP